MKPEKTWMPLYVADYLGDTGHLSGPEHGAYLLLLMHQWRSGTLPDDDRELAMIARTSRLAWRRIGPKVRRFFQVTEAGLVSKRLETIREQQRNRIAQRSDAGRASANARVSKRTTSDTGLGSQTIDIPKDQFNGRSISVELPLNSRCASVEPPLPARPGEKEREIEEEEYSASLRSAADAQGHGQAPRIMSLPLPGEAATRVEDGETPAEVVNREAYREARMILRRLVPGMSDSAMGSLIGWGNKLIGLGPLAVLHCLRDVERDVAAGMLHGDINGAIRGYIRQRATGGRRKGERPKTAGDFLREMGERGEGLDDDDGTPFWDARYA